MSTSSNPPGTGPVRDAAANHPDETTPPTEPNWLSSGSGTFGPDGSWEPHDEAATQAPPPPLARPSGPSWGTVALGLICLVVAGGVLYVELTDVAVDWTRTGPLALVGIGALLVLVGLAALVNRSGRDEDAAS